MADATIESAAPPTPVHFFAAANAYQQTAALRAGVELKVFTAIAAGADTAEAIAKTCGASERGVRILCDALTVFGFLTKSEGRYALAPDAAAFLDTRSPMYLGGTLDFLLAPAIVDGFSDLAGAVRKGGTLAPDGGSLAPEHPVWVQFARAMAPMMRMPAQALAGIVNGNGNPDIKVLDIAAGHGVFGVTVAADNPNARIVALDWPNVLEVARETATTAGVADRHGTLPGSAFAVDFGAGYDVVLLTNFLHHFDRETNETLLRKVHAALAEGGRAVALEFVPNEDRVSPPIPALFSLTMLNATPAGNAYTYGELEAMFEAAGFSRCEKQSLEPSPQTAVIGYK
jgi:ubiquinone/menaquinone biosynthesis C-methylase UbiE